MERNKCLYAYGGGRSQFKKELFEAIDNEDIPTVADLLRSFTNMDVLNDPLTPHCPMTALHFSVGLNSVGICKLLLKYGSDPNNLNCVEKASPLHLSILYDYEDIVALLIRAGGNPLVLDGDGNSCYDLISKNSDLSHLIHYLQAAGAVPESEALVLSPVPYRNFSTPEKKRIGQETQNTTSSAINHDLRDTRKDLVMDTTGTATEESYVTCRSNPSPPSLNQTPPTTVIKSRPRPRKFFDDEVERRRSSRVHQSYFDYAQLMTEDESDAGSVITTTTISSYSQSPSDPSVSTVSESEETDTPSWTSASISASSSRSSEIPMRVLKPSATNENVMTKQPSTSRLPQIQTYKKSPYKTPIKSPSIKEIQKDLKPPYITPTRPTPPVLKYYFGEDKENIRAKPANAGTLSPGSPVKEYSSGFCMELRAALTNFELLHNWGNHKIQFLQSLNSTPTQRASKSYYNYVLLDPKVIKRSNFSGNYLKSDIIRNTEKFQQFLKAIFYIGKGCGNRPLQHLVDAKAKLMNMRRLPESEKTERILQIWKTGQGIIVHSIFHHSSEREANVNEAAMLDAIGIVKQPHQGELTNMKKGSYSGTPAAQWTQKVKNQLGSFLLYKCFCSFVVSDPKVFFPQDV